MTNEQKAWLDGNEGFEMIGQPGGLVRWRQRKWLKPDGTTEVVQNRTPPAKGAFMVGVKEVAEPGKVPGPGR